MFDVTTPLVMGSSAFVTLWASLEVSDNAEAGWAAGVTILVVVVLQLARSVSARVSANTRSVAARELQARFAVGERLVVAAAHDELASLVRALEQNWTILNKATDQGAVRLRVAVAGALAACQEARRSEPSSAFPDFPDPGDESSSYLVDRWARVERTPAWWPSPLRELWADSVGSWLDSIRLLHTREIERVVLAATLYLRAALMVMLPGSGFLMIAGVYPFGPGVSASRNAAWTAAAAWALAVALFSQWVVASVIDRKESKALRTLLFLELLIGAALLLATPSWIAFSFLAGPMNWLLRPRWRLRALVGGVAAGAILLVAGVELAGKLHSTWPAVAEVLAAVLCLGLISNSYGLLFPLVAGHAILVLPTWHLREKRFRQAQWRSRTTPLVTAVDEAVHVAAEERSESPTVAAVEPQLERVRRRLALTLAPDVSKPRLFSRRTYGEVIKAGLDRAARDPEHPIRCAAPMFAPPGLSDEQVESWRLANQLEVAIARLAAEAVRHGEFEIRCTCSKVESDRRVYVSVENDLPVGAIASDVRPGRGSREIAAAVAQLPEGHLLKRGFGDGAAGVLVFKVQFAFAAEARPESTAT